MAATQTQKNEHKNRVRAADREIGPPPAAPSDSDMREVDGEQLSLAEIRKRCQESLRFFLEYCFPMAFRLGWSEDHLRVIEAIERASVFGLLKAIAMPRGHGKTTIIIRAALWAILNKHRRFCSIVAATEGKARRLLKSIKTELIHNERLAELYGPELHAIHSLNNEARKAAQQTCGGELTGVEWTVDQVCLGQVADSMMNGAAISVCGITGNIRGQEITLPSGEVLRPDLGLVDDPQTKKSAKSRQQCDERHETMMGDVLGMAGPDEDFAAFCTCTVIYEDDLADRLLDPEQSPDWAGDKCKLVYQWPKNENIWDEYREIRVQELRDGGDGSKSNEFVKENFEEMHLGSRVGWEERRGGGKHEGRRCLSALQYAYNLRFRDAESFFAEYQNEPLASHSEIPFELRVEDLVGRTTSYIRNRVPEECQKITAQIDVQKNVLFYCVTAWTLEGRGHVIDYGTYPDQRRSNFSKRDIRNTLQRVAGTEALEEAIYGGLEKLSEKLLGREYKRGDGVAMAIDRMGIDARWGYSTATVRRFARESEFKGRLVPTFGQYVGVNSKPWHKWKVNKGESAKLHCRLQPPPKNIRGVRELLVDTNYWKSFTAQRLLAGKGSTKTIVLFKGKPHNHRMFAEHLACETPQIKTGKTGNTLVEWEQPGSGAENDFWDCLVGTCVLASVEGVRVHPEKDTSRQTGTEKPRSRRRRVAALKC